jgi:hypothetical protein
MKKLISVAALVLATACNTSTLVSNLNAIIAGVDAALPIVQAVGGMPSETQELATEYLTAVSTATSQAATIIQSTDSGVLKATALMALFAKVVLPIIPNTPPALAVDLNDIAAAITAFENAVQASGPNAVQMPNRSFHLSEKQKVELLEIKAKADAALAQLRMHSPDKK